MTDLKRAGTTIVAALALAAFAPPASAETIIDRAPVGGVPGETATKGYSSSLAVGITAPPGYERAMGYTGRMGNWLGPVYAVSGNPAVQNRTTLEWTLRFVRGRSLAAAAKDAGDMRLPQVAAKATTVAHRLGARRIGRLRAYTAIDAEKAPGARVQAAIAVDLGRRVSAVVLLHLGDPATYDRAAGGVKMTVNGRPAPEWNLVQAKAALARVTVEGNLPVGRIRATARGRRVSGSLRDIAGHAVGDIALTLQRRAAGRWVDAAEGRSTATGAFALTAPGAGRYRVQAVNSGGAVAGRALTVR